MASETPDPKVMARRLADLEVRVTNMATVITLIARDYLNEESIREVIEEVLKEHNHPNHMELAFEQVKDDINQTRAELEVN